MLLLTTTALPSMHKWAHPQHGRLLTPRHYCKAKETANQRIPWALDNDAFGSFNANQFTKACEAIKNLPGCKFVTAPDAFDADAGIGLHDQTLELWNDWHPYMQTLNQPVAFVAQNGATPHNMPWHQLDAVFIGGCTTYKLGETAQAITAEARRQGKWVHMGRVNSAKRIAYAKSIGVQSVDGSGWARFRNAMMPIALRALDTPTQLRLDT